MEDTVTEAVRKQYEAYSYPPPIEDAEQFRKKWGPLTCDPQFAGIQLWPEGRPRQDLRILCAGCGSSQAALIALNNPNCVVCGYGIIHVPEPQKALSEMRRVLKPGGFLAVSIWEAAKPGNGFGLLFGAIRKHGDLNVPLPHGPDFFQFSEPDKLKAAIQEIEFRDAAVETVEQTWELADPLGVITAILEGAVRARALLRAQTEDVRNSISAAVVEGMRQYRSSDGVYRVPMPALVGSGRK